MQDDKQKLQSEDDCLVGTPKKIKEEAVLAQNVDPIKQS